MLLMKSFTSLRLCSPFLVEESSILYLECIFCSQTSRISFSLSNKTTIK